MHRLHAILIVSTYKIAVLVNLRVVVGKEAASNLIGFAGWDYLVPEYLFQSFSIKYEFLQNHLCCSIILL